MAATRVSGVHLRRDPTNGETITSVDVPALASFPGLALTSAGMGDGTRLVEAHQQRIETHWVHGGHKERGVFLQEDGSTVAFVLTHLDAAKGICVVFAGWATLTYVNPDLALLNCLVPLARLAKQLPRRKQRRFVYWFADSPAQASLAKRLGFELISKPKGSRAHSHWRKKVDDLLS